MSTTEEPYERYMRLRQQATDLGWKLDGPSEDILYRLVNVQNPGIYRPAGEPRFAFTLDDVERELADILALG